MEQGRRWETERGERVVGVGDRKQHSIAKRLRDTKGKRMTGTRVKPARRRNAEEEGDRSDGRGGGQSQALIQTCSLATDNISSPWLFLGSRWVSCLKNL